MKFRNSFFLALIVLAASAFTVNTYLTTPPETSNVETASPKTWTDVATAVQLAKSDQKKILVDVYTDWCKWCKVMDEKTFADPKVSSFLAENFHLAKFNAEQKEVLNFNGKKYAFKKKGKRGYHEFAEEILNGRLGYPSLVVFDSELNKLEVIRGFKSASDLMQTLSNMTDS